MSRLVLPAGWELPIWGQKRPAGDGCQPTVIMELSPLKETDDSPVYRHKGACFGCGWLGPDRDDENPAAEDAHDHTHPGWLTLPGLVITEYRYDDHKARQRLAHQLASLYPPDWVRRAGPTLTWRSPPFTRHVPDGGLFGGYCMARVRNGHEVRPVGEVTQTALLF